MLLSSRVGQPNALGVFLGTPAAGQHCIPHMEFKQRRSSKVSCPEVVDDILEKKNVPVSQAEHRCTRVTLLQLSHAVSLPLVIARFLHAAGVRLACCG